MVSPGLEVLRRSLRKPACGSVLRGLRGAAERAEAAGCFFARLPVFRFDFAAFSTRDMPRKRCGSPSHPFWAGP